MEHTLRATQRKLKDITLGYTDIEAKVREATSNDPWGAPSALLDEIAQATHSPSMLRQIMEMIWKRMNDSGKNWRHVMKALTLLDYLVKNGSDRCASYAHDHVHDIRTLKEFQYIDENGKDQGVNVRHKSKELAALVLDPERVREEREKAKNLRNRLAGNSNFSGGAYGSDYGGNYSSGANYSSGGGSYGGGSSYGGGGGGGGGFGGGSGGQQGSGNAYRTGDDEDAEYQRALQESKMTYEVEKAAREQQYQSWDDGRQDIQPPARSQPQPQSQPGIPPLAQPVAAPRRSVIQTAPTASTGENIFDSSPFGTDPFGGSTFPAPTQQPAPVAQPKKTADPFGNDPFGSQPTVAAATTSRPAADPFGDDTFGKPSGGFDSAFDGGKEAKKLPHQTAAANDPNALLANIARNAVVIDPFAQMATSRVAAAPASTSTSSGFGAQQPGFGQPSSNGFGAQGSSNGFGQPAAGAFGGQPVAGGFAGQPMAGAFGGQPMSGGFGGQPMAAGYGGQPTGGFGGQPVGGFGGQPQGQNALGNSNPFGAPQRQGSSAFNASPSPDPFGDLGSQGAFHGDVLVPDNKQSQTKPTTMGIVNLDDLGTKQHSTNPFSTQKSQKFDWGEPKPSSKPLNELRATQNGPFF